MMKRLFFIIIPIILLWHMNISTTVQARVAMRCPGDSFILYSVTNLNNNRYIPAGVRDFPSLHIYSYLDPFTQLREYWHRGTLSVSGIYEAFLFNDEPVRIRGRGNSTWARGPEKRPLRLRFEEPRTILDSSHSARDWVLIANLFDMSLIRTHLAFYLASRLDGIYWTPFSRIVHLYINGVYQGVYQLADERDVGDNRAQLSFDPDPAVSEYFFEKDGQVSTWLNAGYVLDVDFFEVDNIAIDIRFPHRRYWDGHLEYLRDFVLNVDETINTRDFEEIVSLIDIDSFIDFYIVQELFKNIDVNRRSVFMQIKGQGDDRRLYFGPVWDFDRSSGNNIYWTTPKYIFAGLYNNWFRNMLEVPEIFDLISIRWNQISNYQVASMIEYAGFLLDNYEESFERNFIRHDHILGGNPTWFEMLPQETREIDTFAGQIDYLINWFEVRINWLDAFYNRRYDWINEWWTEVVNYR